MWPLRSMLFIPAHKTDWVQRVDRFRPDSIVLDLEDAVPRNLKVAARAQCREAIGVLKAKGIPAFVRINGWDEGGRDDVLAVAAAGFSGVMLPKARDVGQVRELDRVLAYVEGREGLDFESIVIMPLPETAEGLADARLLVAASPRCCTLAGIEHHLGGQVKLLGPLQGGAKSHGARWPMASIIGTALEDLAAVRTLVTRARSLGFSGAILIHPTHVAVANEVFAPTPDEVDYYAGLIEAMQAAEARGDAAVRYRGIMVDYAMLPRAHDVLAEAKRFGIARAGA